jgi:hypothetical protein
MKFGFTPSIIQVILVTALFGLAFSAELNTLFLEAEDYLDKTNGYKFYAGAKSLAMLAFFYYQYLLSIWLFYFCL